MKFTREDIRSVFLIALGTALASAAFSFFTFPNEIASGGVTGIAQILNHLFRLPVGLTTIVINIPLFVMAWKKFGLRFILGSALGMTANSLFIDLFNSFSLCATDDLLLAAVYGGLIKGFGYGLVYATGATTGGSDIVARSLRRRWPHINFGTLSLAVDAVVVVLFAFTVKRFDGAMYSIIAMFVSSRVVNFVLYGTANAAVCYIITICPQAIAQAIGEGLHRGATLLKAQGAYTGEERSVVLCVIKQQQIAELKKLISAIDERSFVIVTHSHEVFGKNFSNITTLD